MQDIRKISFSDLVKFLENHNEPAFRAKQIYEWIWKKHVFSFDQMSNISKKLREHLQKHFYFNVTHVSQNLTSQDGTVKFIFRLYDGKKVEGVLIPTQKRITACISSQVGCSLDCSFCATGRMKLLRNLESSEIIDQVVHIQQKSLELYQRPITNIVFMGMGEPLLNYSNVIRAYVHLTDPKEMGLSTRRLTISTAGIAKGIKRLADDNIKAKLALSLHAPTDEKRIKIMSIHAQNNLKVLHEALQYYYSRMKQYVTYEYLLLKDFNDTLEDAKALVKWCRKIPCKVNLIEYNNTGTFTGSNPEQIKIFEQYLLQHDIPTSIRKSRGQDINAACGQLIIQDKSIILKE
ncbi:MAG: 23S rRNA (adenine(2503)-C(2))-methyltransferase RlmN [Bacteroidia bacterium]|nr:23S rRNA (adenine(2503)-C(2))-methyltransferase RlmN [Bacteroidia bacterium]MDW8346112.1 23S rRNA (adenine(2503)-C(2))-methyltransferase RlmN [Bacteroidia bacterium]